MTRKKIRVGPRKKGYSRPKNKDRISENLNLKMNKADEVHEDLPNEKKIKKECDDDDEYGKDTTMSNNLKRINVDNTTDEVGVPCEKKIKEECVDGDEMYGVTCYPRSFQQEETIQGEETMQGEETIQGEEVASLSVISNQDNNCIHGIEKTATEENESTGLIIESVYSLSDFQNVINNDYDFNSLSKFGIKACSVPLSDFIKHDIAEKLREIIASNSKPPIVQEFQSSDLFHDEISSMKMSHSDRLHTQKSNHTHDFMGTATKRRKVIFDIDNDTADCIFDCYHGDDLDEMNLTREETHLPSAVEVCINGTSVVVDTKRLEDFESKRRKKRLLMHSYTDQESLILNRDKSKPKRKMQNQKELMKSSGNLILQRDNHEREEMTKSGTNKPPFTRCKNLLQDKLIMQSLPSITSFDERYQDSETTNNHDSKEMTNSGTNNPSFTRCKNLIRDKLYMKAAPAILKAGAELRCSKPLMQGLKETDKQKTQQKDPNKNKKALLTERLERLWAKYGQQLSFRTVGIQTGNGSKQRSSVVCIDKIFWEEQSSNNKKLKAKSASEILIKSYKRKRTRSVQTQYDYGPYLFKTEKKYVKINTAGESLIYDTERHTVEIRKKVCDKNEPQNLQQVVKCETDTNTSLGDQQTTIEYKNKEQDFENKTESMIKNACKSPFIDDLYKSQPEQFPQAKNYEGKTYISYDKKGTPYIYAITENKEYNLDCCDLIPNDKIKTEPQEISSISNQDLDENMTYPEEVTSKDKEEKLISNKLREFTENQNYNVIPNDNINSEPHVRETSKMTSQSMIQTSLSNS